MTSFGAILVTLQRRYGVENEEAERQIRGFEKTNADLMRR